MDSIVYSFWDVFRLKLKSNNSYQYSPVQASYCSSRYPGLRIVAQKEPRYCKDIAGVLLAYDIMEIREFMRNLILNDNIYTLLEIRKIMYVME